MHGVLHRRHSSDGIGILIDNFGGKETSFWLSASLHSDSPSLVLGRKIVVCFKEDYDTLCRASRVGPGKAFLEFPCPTLVLTRAFPGDEAYWGQHWEKIQSEKIKQPYRFVWSDAVQPNHMFTNVDEAKQAIASFLQDQETAKITTQTYKHLSDDLDQKISEHQMMNEEDGWTEQRLLIYVNLCTDILRLICFVLIALIIMLVLNYALL